MVYAQGGVPPILDMLPAYEAGKPADFRKLDVCQKISLEPIRGLRRVSQICLVKPGFHMVARIARIAENCDLRSLRF